MDLNTLLKSYSVCGDKPKRNVKYPTPREQLIKSIHDQREAFAHFSNGTAYKRINFGRESTARMWLFITQSNSTAVMPRYRNCKLLAEPLQVAKADYLKFLDDFEQCVVAGDLDVQLSGVNQKLSRKHG